MAWMWAVMRIRQGEAFFHENRVRYLTNYIRRRMRDRDQGPNGRPSGGAKAIAPDERSIDRRAICRVLSPDSARQTPPADSSD
jgi:hypothetical protein